MTELESTRKETAVAYLKYYTDIFLEGLKNMRNHSIGIIKSPE
jgi:hypothetical protein